MIGPEYLDISSILIVIESKKMTLRNEGIIKRKIWHESSPSAITMHCRGSAAHLKKGEN
jgi:hypothetical protein